jgi:hypothetical protein
MRPRVDWISSGRPQLKAPNAPIHAPLVGTAALSRRVGKVVAYPPLGEMSAVHRREFHEALLDADSFEDLPGKWQAGILEAEQNRPNLRAVGND